MKLPRQLLIYQCDEVDGKPVYAVAVALTEIPEEYVGQKVGTYERVDTGVFYVTKATR